MRVRRLLLLLWLVGAPARAETLTIATWGGAYEAAQRTALFEPFEAETGIRIETVRHNGGVAPLRGGAIAQADLVDMIRADARTACEDGLLMPFDHTILAAAPDGTPPAADFEPGSAGPCWIAHLIFATVIAFNDSAFPGEKPDEVADFFDLARFPGKRALRDAPVAMLEWALRAYGAPRAQLYDLLSTERGLRLAFRRLDALRGETLWWVGAEESARLLAEGHVAMASGYNGRFFHQQVAAGAPITVIWDTALIERNVWAVPAGAANASLARRFIRFATHAERMAALANLLPYGPTRRSAEARVGIHAASGTPMRAHLPVGAGREAVTLDKDDAWYAATETLRRRLYRQWRDAGEAMLTGSGQ
jgi:putative spermidine/putrescine transport system substrate-binding protein